MLTNIVLLGLATIATPRVTPHQLFSERPRIEVWSTHGDGVYTRGQGVKVYIRADQDAFVTLFRVDTDGRVRVLFPQEPWEDNFVRGGRDFEVLGRNSATAFYVDDYPGVGYLFAVASYDRFDYSAIQTEDHWDYHTIADGRVRGDPYVALTELAERIVPEGYEDWDYDIVPYSVQQRYEYPRFLCYDCHAYASFPYWDPYWRSCVRFRIVYYDDPYYYPYRYYGGTRVVFVRPYRPQPRYVFKDRDGSGRDRFVTREQNRPVNDNTRRVAPTRSAGTTSFIPAPRDRAQVGRGAPENRSGSGVTRSSVGGHDRTAESGRRRPREEQSSERQTTANPERGDRGNASERSKTSERGQANERPEGLRVPADQTRSNPSDRATPSRESRPEPRSTPRVESPRIEPRHTPPRAESPRAESPRASPQRDQPRAEPPRAERPRSEPRSEPKARSSEPKNNEQPELRRRKPE
jgi:uncharacterized protein DUF4384